MVTMRECTAGGKTWQGYSILSILQQCGGPGASWQADNLGRDYGHVVIPYGAGRGRPVTARAHLSASQAEWEAWDAHEQRT